jgi:hypothetical protein
MIKSGFSSGLRSKWKFNLENIILFTSTNVWNKNYDKIYKNQGKAMANYS